MTETLNIQVQLLPTTVELNAKPGDKLMILNGMCIGVYSGSAPTPEVAPRKRVNEAPGASVRKPPNTEGRSVVRQQIIDFFAQQPFDYENTTSNVLNALGVPMQDSERWLPRDVLRALMKEGILAGELIEPTNPRRGMNIRRGPNFIMVKRSGEFEPR